MAIINAYLVINFMLPFFNNYLDFGHHIIDYSPAYSFTIDYGHLNIIIDYSYFILKPYLDSFITSGFYH